MTITIAVKPTLPYSITIIGACVRCMQAGPPKTAPRRRGTRPQSPLWLCPCIKQLWVRHRMCAMASQKAQPFLHLLNMCNPCTRTNIPVQPVCVNLTTWFLPTWFPFYRPHTRAPMHPWARVLRTSAPYTCERAAHAHLAHTCAPRMRSRADGVPQVRGSHLSNTTCLTHVFFNHGESDNSILWSSLTRRNTHKANEAALDR